MVTNGYRSTERCKFEMAKSKDLAASGQVCFYCSLEVPDKISLALHYVR